MSKKRRKIVKTSESDFFPELPSRRFRNLVVIQVSGLSSIFKFGGVPDVEAHPLLALEWQLRRHLGLPHDRLHDRDLLEDVAVLVLQPAL